MSLRSPRSSACRSSCREALQRKFSIVGIRFTEKVDHTAIDSPPRRLPYTRMRDREHFGDTNSGVFCRWICHCETYGSLALRRYNSAAECETRRRLVGEL